MQNLTLFGLPIEYWSLGIAALAAIGTILASGVAIWGIRSWRSEHAGRRKADLASEVLTTFYHARRIFDYIRDPIHFGNEALERPGRENEENRLLEMRDNYAVPLIRLYKESEFFKQIDFQRQKFRAIFGEEFIRNFDEILEIRAQIATSAQMLFNFSEDVIAGEKFSSWKSWEADIGWATDDDDPLKPRIENAIKEIEEICLPLIRIK